MTTVYAMRVALKMQQKIQKTNMKKDKKNISKNIKNGTFVITRDDLLRGADGNSTKIRMGTVVDSNRQDHVAIVKYTTSKRNGTHFENDKGFDGFGNEIYSEDVQGNPLIIDSVNQVIKRGNSKRDISSAIANEIKRQNLKTSKYRNRNRNALKKLKGRKK